MEPYQRLSAQSERTAAQGDSVDQSQTVGTLAVGCAARLDFQFVACSGAKTWQAASGNPLNWGFDGNFHEKPQTDSGVLQF